MDYRFILNDSASLRNLIKIRISSTKKTGKQLPSLGLTNGNGE
jgi:hypothetical protein